MQASPGLRASTALQASSLSCRNVNDPRCKQDRRCKQGARCKQDALCRARLLKFVCAFLALTLFSVTGELPVLAKTRQHATAPHKAATKAKSKATTAPTVVKRKGSSHSIIKTARGAKSHASAKSRLTSASRRTAHGRHGRVRATAGLAHRQKSDEHKAPVPEPTAENVQDGGSLSHVYQLYDEGLNARLAGNYEEATKKLLAAATSYTSSKSGLTFEAMINFELGQAAESGGNVSVAADAYTRCLRIKPSFVDASVHLTNMLMRAGEAKAALTQARETAVANPSDARAHELLGLILDKNGFVDDAKLERSKAEALLQRRALPNPASSIHQAPEPEPVAPQPSTTDDNDKDGEVTAPEKKPVEQPVDSDVMKE